jgi:hypothetical protein
VSGISLRNDLQFIAVRFVFSKDHVNSVNRISSERIQEREDHSIDHQVLALRPILKLIQSCLKAP